MEKATARDQVVEEELSDQEEVRIWVLWCQIVACTLSKCSLLKKKKSVENRKQAYASEQRWWRKRKL